MKKELDDILRSVQGIRALQVQLAQAVKKAHLPGWENIDLYITNADDRWQEFNDTHKRIYNKESNS